MEILKRTREVSCDDRWEVAVFMRQLDELIYHYSKCNIFVTIFASLTGDKSLPRSKVDQTIRDEIYQYLNFNVDVSICTTEVIV